MISKGIKLCGHNLQDCAQARKVGIYWEKIEVTNVSWSLECFSLGLRFTAFVLSQNCNIWELKVPDIVYSTMQHTNTPCEKKNNNKKISPTSVSLLPSRGNIEPILITITCTHHARSRKSWKNKISKGLSATSKANRNDGKRDLRFILVYMTEANKW